MGQWWSVRGRVGEDDGLDGEERMGSLTLKGTLG